MTTPSDEALMRRYQDGDAAAFETLYARYRGDLYRFLLRQLDKSLAEEMYQEIWMRVIKARDRYQATARFRTYLYTIAHHRLADHFRRAGRWQTEFDDPDGLPDGDRNQPEIQTRGREAVTALLAAIEQLPAPQREAFLLKEEAGMKLDEIAAIAGTNRETIKSRLRYATHKLRSLLSEVYP